MKNPDYDLSSQFLRVKVRTYPIGSSDRSTRLSLCKAKLSSLIVKVSTSVSSGFAVLQDHKTLSIKIKPPASNKYKQFSFKFCNSLCQHH